MDKIKTVKIKNPDGSVSEESYIISVDARNVDMENEYDLQETIGTININDDGSIAEQLKNNQKEINIINTNIIKKPYYYNTVADMKADVELKDGDMAITLGYHEKDDNGAGSYAIRNKKEEDIDDAGFIHQLNNGLIAELLIENNNLRPELFGAYGDGIHDDSDALQNYINCSKTGVNIYLSVPKAVYKITKQIDFKQKGIIGNGFSRQDNVYYNMNSIKVMADGNYFNENENLNNVALIHVGADIRNLQLWGPGTSSSISGMQVPGYNVTIDNINISGFYDQIKVIGATVSFRVTDLMSISCGHAGIHILDTSNNQSTTAYFNNCSWQWGNYPVLFDKEVYGSSFKNIIIEYMSNGLTADCFINCIFSNIWCEETNSSKTKIRWLTSTSNQQLNRNIYTNLYLRTPWINDDTDTGSASSNSQGGVLIQNNIIKASDNKGHRIAVNRSGIHTEHNAWADRDSRRLTITTQATETASDLPHTPADLYISAPNGSLFFANNPSSDHSAVTMKRLIGEDSNGDAYYGTDIYTKERKSWTTYDNGSATSGYFQAPMFLTYDKNRSTSPTNNGWKITVNTSEKFFDLGRATGQTKELTDPHIIISGIVDDSSTTGSFSPIIPTIQLIEAYSGSYTTYGVVKGFRIVFKNLSNERVMPKRFTIAITSSKT